MKNNDHSKISRSSLVLMIFSSIFGFSNSLTAFYQMGYSSIIWYIVTAILFFLPSALIFADMVLPLKELKVESFHGLKDLLMKK